MAMYIHREVIFLKNLHFSQQHLLNETEHKVLSCILNAIEQGDTKINIRMIARQAYVSTTTVIKLAKKLGYQGYSDMIYSLRHSVDEEQKPAEGIELTSILDPVNEPAIDMFVELLLKHQNNCIFVIGLGFSTIASSYFMRRLATLGFLAYDGSPSDMMRREDTPSLCIFFSKSGETKDLINIAQCAKAAGHDIALITANGSSALADLSSPHLVIRSTGSVAYNVPDFFIGRTIILLEYILSKLVIYLH